MPRVQESLTPLACVPGAIAADERVAHLERLNRLFAVEVRERRAHPDGYAYRFDAEALEELERWIAAERQCCPFLRFSLDVTPRAGPIWLRLAGPPGTPRFLDEVLPASTPTPNS